MEKLLLAVSRLSLRLFVRPVLGSPREIARLLNLSEADVRKLLADQEQP